MLQIQIDQQLYTKICKLGEGTYGTVYLYQQIEKNKSIFSQFFNLNEHQQSIYYAFKKYKQSNNNRDGANFSCLREINILQTLQNQHIISCYQVIYRQLQNQHQIYLVLPFHLELDDLIHHSLYTTNQQNNQKNLCLQLIKGLFFLHSKYIFHRDLKPMNLFISRKGILKIADFGFAKQFGTPNRKYTANVCTKEYRAPQIFFGTHYYTQKSDIWSFGCIMSYIFTNKVLFASQTSNDLQTLSRIFYIRGTPNEVNWPQYDKFPKYPKFTPVQSKDLQKYLNIGAQTTQIIDWCLQFDPAKRPSAYELLNSQYFKNIICKPFEVEEIYQQKLSKLLSKNMEEQ